MVVLENLPKLEDDIILKGVADELKRKTEELVDIYVRMLTRFLELEPEVKGSESWLIPEILKNLSDELCILILDKVVPTWREDAIRQMQAALEQQAQNDLAQEMIRH